LLQESSADVEDIGDRSLEYSLLHNLSLPSEDLVQREFTFQPVSPAAYTSQLSEDPRLRPSVYSDSTLSSDLTRQHVSSNLPNMSTLNPPPSLTLQPPTSPPCVQLFEDTFQPPASPSDLLAHYGFSSSLSSNYSQSPSSSLLPHPTFQAPPSPQSIEQVSPSCYKRHLSLPTSPSQPIVSKFNFLTPPLRSPASPLRSRSPAAFPLSPRAVSPVPFGSPNTAMSSATSGDTQRQIGPSTSLMPPTSPRHMLTVPMASSPCRSPNFFGPSLQPYQHSRSRSPSPISTFCRHCF